MTYTEESSSLLQIYTSVEVKMNRFSPDNKTINYIVKCNLLSIY